MIEDPLAARMLAPAQRVQAAILRAPGLRTLGRNRAFTYLAARTLFYDQFVTDAMQDGIAQVVILASGYDSRGWRLARRGVHFSRSTSPTPRRSSASVHRRAGRRLSRPTSPIPRCHTAWLVPGMTPGRGLRSRSRD